MNLKNTRIVFMGSPEIAVPTLEKLISLANVVGVVTQPDRRAGRGRKMVSPAVKMTAEKAGIPIMQPEKMCDPAAFEQLAAWQPDLIVVMAYGQILRKNVLELPAHGCLNLHASLLPRWRGASPIQAAILAGDQETGISLMQMDPGMDTGPVYCMEKLAILPDDTAQTLSDRLSELAADLIERSLPEILRGELFPSAQPTEGVTYAKLIKKDDGVLDFTRPAAELVQQVRAFSPWPSAFFFEDGQPVRVCAAHSVALPEIYRHLPLGAHVCLDGFPAITTSEGALVLDEVHCAGRKQVSGKAFLSGHRTWEDA